MYDMVGQNFDPSILQERELVFIPNKQKYCQILTTGSNTTLYFHNLNVFESGSIKFTSERWLDDSNELICEEFTFIDVKTPRLGVRTRVNRPSWLEPRL